jgi:solute carrier family 50 protein (sugar transporter)
MKVVKVLLPVVAGFVAVTLLVLLLIPHDHQKRKTVIGTLCAVFAVAMYVSPLTIMVRASSTLTYPVLISNL